MRKNEKYPIETPGSYGRLEFMMRNGSLYERRYIDGTEAAGLSVRATDAAFPGGSSGALGTDANFMFEWLRPRAAATLDEVCERARDEASLLTL